MICKLYNAYRGKQISQCDHTTQSYTYTPSIFPSTLFNLVLYGAEGLYRGVESRCARSLYLFFKDLTMKNCHDAVTVIICLCWLYQAYSKWRATLFTHLVPVVRPSVQWVTFFTSGSYLETWKRKYLYIEKFILWLCYSP